MGKEGKGAPRLEALLPTDLPRRMLLWRQRGLSLLLKDCRTGALLELGIGEGAGSVEHPLGEEPNIGKGKRKGKPKGPPLPDVTKSKGGKGKGKNQSKSKPPLSVGKEKAASKVGLSSTPLPDKLDHQTHRPKLLRKDRNNACITHHSPSGCIRGKDCVYLYQNDSVAKKPLPANPADVQKYQGRPQCTTSISS